MVNVSQGYSEVSLVGGPAQVVLQLDYGPAGQRGSQIYTGPGNPTDPGVEIPSKQVNDLFINLDPSSMDYLFLWQYNSQDGVIAWRKVLRLVPNTLLINPLIKFINGEAHTTVKFNNSYIDVKGLYFPLSGILETVDSGGTDPKANIDPKDFNVQQNILSNTPVASGINLEEISDLHTVEYISGVDPTNPLNVEYSTFENFPFGELVLKIKLTASEYSLSSNSWAKMNGYRFVHLIATIAGRSFSVIDFDISQVSVENDTITIDEHGLSTGDKVVYLSNLSVPIGGLSDQEEYFVNRLDSSTISLVNLLGQPIDITASDATGNHSIGVLGVGF